jgi:hypothetical protein
MADLDQDQPIGGLAGAEVTMTPKGQIVTKGPTNLTEASTQSILQNMQNLIDQRTSPWNQFMSGLKDASAWTAGGAQGPTEALTLREAEKDKQDKEVMDMRSQMATLRSNADQNAIIRAQLAAMGPQGGSTGSMGGSGGVGTPGGIPSDVYKMAVDMGQTDPPGAKKYLADTMKELAKVNAGPDMYKTDAVKVQKYDPQSNTFVADTISPMQYQEGLRSGFYRNINGTIVGGYPSQPGLKPPVDSLSKDPQLQKIAVGENPSLQNIPNTSGTSTAHGLYQITQPTYDMVKAQFPELKNTTWEQFKANPDLQTAVAERLKSINGKKLQDAGLPQTDINHRTVWFSGNTKLASAPDDAPITTALTPEQIAANAWTQGKTVGQVRDILNQQMQKAPAQQAPAAPMGGLAQPNVSTQQAQNQSALQQKQQEANITANAEANKPAQTSFEKNTDSQTLGRQVMLINSMDTILKRIENNPDQQVVGLYNRPDVSSAIGTALSKGIQTPVGGISADIEDAMQKMGNGVTKQDIQDRAELKQILQNFAFEIAQSATGQGSISDNERKMFQDMIGSASSTPEMLRKTQQFLQTRNEYLKKVRSMYDDRVERGESINFQQFKASRPYRELSDEYFNKLAKIGTGPDKGLIKRDTGATQGPKPYDDANKEAAYQAWKKARLGKQ